MIEATIITGYRQPRYIHLRMNPVVPMRLLTVDSTRNVRKRSAIKPSYGESLRDVYTAQLSSICTMPISLSGSADAIFSTTSSLTKRQICNVDCQQSTVRPEYIKGIASWMNSSCLQLNTNKSDMVWQASALMQLLFLSFCEKSRQRPQNKQIYGSLASL